jgi:hypothetical protein
MYNERIHLLIYSVSLTVLWLLSQRTRINKCKVCCDKTKFELAKKKEIQKGEGIAGWWLLSIFRNFLFSSSYRYCSRLLSGQNETFVDALIFLSVILILNGVSYTLFLLLFLSLLSFSFLFASYFILLKVMLFYLTLCSTFWSSTVPLRQTWSWG